MITKKNSSRLLIGLLLGISTQVSAHHGTSVNYDGENVMTIKGVVTNFLWRNPHSALVLDVTTESGEVVSHAIELPSPASMAHSDRGWTRRTFRPGDLVEIVVHPSRTDAPVSKAADCELGGCNPIINGKRFEAPKHEALAYEASEQLFAGDGCRFLVGTHGRCDQHLRVARSGIRPR